jgi:NAD(P)-dependent dehydrogenase (short-subunit alcohol dehydrogenase family)
MNAMDKDIKSAPVAVVTGGSRGIGRAVAVALARQGWNICFSYVSNENAAAQTSAQIQSAGGRALAVKVDIANCDDVKRLFKATTQEFGRLDALVNNAGVVGEPRSILDVDDAHLTAVFRTNVLGSFFCASEAARLMSTQKGGSGGAIVNMSSAAARHGGMPNEAHYAASKGAIDSLSVALAKELAPHGIRVNAVRPGLINTEIHEAHGGQELINRIGPTVPIGRAGTAAEVAEVVAFLCGPLSSYMHGALVDVSGGR